MSKFWAVFYKEFLLVVRDKAGLLILFLMPLALIIVMAIIMDAPFRDYQDSSIDLLIVNEDADSLGNQIENGLTNSEIFNVVTRIDNNVITEELVKKLVADGDYLIGIVIPKGATNAINTKINELVSNTLSQFGMVDQVEKEGNSKNPSVRIYLDPAVKKSFENSVASSVKSYTSQIESKMIIEGFFEQLSEDGSHPKSVKNSFIEFEKIYAGTLPEEDRLEITSVQHNVPAWTVFAMFFIVVTLASNMIKEREGGSMLRLQIAPGSYFILLLGKLSLYLVVCLFQFFAMLAIGLWFMPVIGLPSLVIGSNFFAIIATALAISVAATGFGVMIGSLFTSHQQASIFGAVINVILAAIGGIMVPVFAMPPTMKTIAGLTPLNWAMEAFNDLFLRNGGIAEVIFEISLLLTFALLTLLVTAIASKRRFNSN